MSGGKKKIAALREGYDSDTSYDPVGELSAHRRAEPHETRHKSRPQASVLQTSEPTNDTMAMIRMLMEEQRKAEGEREEARRVADMERDEARKQEEVRRENLRVEREEARMAEENRRATLRVEREEARRAEDLVREQTLKVQLAAEAVENARRQAELQTEQNAKYLEQQIALMRVQAEIGQEAARLHREDMSASKMRDRAVAS